jgi:arabinose-5-phosphate isomerase
MASRSTDSDPLQTALRVLDIEARAIQELAPRLGADFKTAFELCLGCEGRVVVVGMGKSGHIAGKIAATLASTGTPAFFVHAAEASHGDLGMITRKDVVIAISNSGETNEVITLLPLLKRLGIDLITITGNLKSTLAEASSVTLDISVNQEACPLDLTPTASTTATLAMGDALAVALLESRGFTEEDFAMSHPGGSLGRQLLLRIADVMHTGDEIPSATSDTSLADGLLEITTKGLGMTAIVDQSQQLLGIFTDGDLRRTLDQGIDIHATKMQDVMITGCKTVQPEILAAEALHIMEQHKINALLVVDGKNRVVGALNIHDLFRAGVV